VQHEMDLGNGGLIRSRDMRWQIRAFVVFGLLFICVGQRTAMTEPLASPLAAVVEDTGAYKPGSVMVRFVDPLRVAPTDRPWTGPRTRISIQAIVADRILPGSVISRDLGSVVPGLVCIRLPAGVSVQEAVAIFNSSPYVVYAEPNYKLRLAYFPRDAWFDSQWALHNTGQSIRIPGQMGQYLPPGLPGADINAPEGWDLMGKGKEGDASKVFVAVLDTGVDYNHPDLQPNLWSETISLIPADTNLADPNFNPNDPNFLYTSYGADYVDDPPADIIDPQGNPYSYDPNVMDTHYHGTAVAGIIGATWDNTGIAGVCKNVKIVTVRITDGNEINMDTAVAGFAFALSFGYNAPKNKAHIINCSWGTQSWPQSLYSAIASAPDVLVVAAAGNMFDDPNVPATDMDSQPFYPAGFGSAAGARMRGADPLPNVISVMATDRFDQPASYSNWGPRTVHIGAPGDAIITLVPVLGTPALTADGIPAIVGTPESEGVGLVSGTSYAAPHVTGACALALAINPNLTPVRIRYLITHPDAVDPVLPGLCTSGGRLNLAKFLKLVPAGKVRNLRTGKDYTGLTPITDAIKEAATGDELVADANHFYAEPTINFGGKLIKLRSGDLDAKPIGAPSPTDTIISYYDQRQAEAGQVIVPTQPTVLFANNENERAILEGFTIQDGAPGIQIGQVVIQNKKEVLKVSSPQIVNCIVTKNKVSGGIICLGGNAAILDCKVVDNIAATSGGGIYVSRGASIQITRCSVSRNVATDGWGGGICLDEGSAQIRTTKVLSNQARWYGGGIYLYRAQGPIVDCNVTGNYSYIDGGGIYWEGAEAPVDLSDTIIAANRAFYAGGGIGCIGTAGRISNCLLAENVSEGTNGGALHVRSSILDLGNCTFARNHCLPWKSRGGAIYQEDRSTLQIKDSIFYDNNDTAIAHGDTGSATRISYCLFYANAQGDFRRAGQNYLITDPAIQSVVAGNNNIAADPRFVRGRLGNYYLSNWNAGQILDLRGRPIDPDITPGSQPSDANSPAIDAGSDMASALGMDQFSTRTDNEKDTGRVDIGFHYNDPQENLSFMVLPVVTPKGKADVTPMAEFFKEFSQVLIKVTVTDPAYQLAGWKGTDNDAKLDLDPNGLVAPFQWNVLTVVRPSQLDYIQVDVKLESKMVELRARVTGATTAGEISPERVMVRRGQTVPVSVLLKDKNYAIRWTGTNDDLSQEFINTVTMAPPYATDPRGRDYKEVIAYLYRPRTIILGPGGIDYSIIDGASEGDVVIIPAGTHTASPRVQTLVIDKGITITGPNPDSPDTTASTVVKNYQLVITNSHVVIEGLTFIDQSKIYIQGCSPTIRNCRFIDCYKWAGDGLNTTPEPDDGPDGGSAVGGAIEITGLGDTRPKIQNCLFSGCFVRGGSGGDGDNGAGGHPEGYDGGWPGLAYGGAVYCSGDADVLFQDCQFDGCYAIGGNGGDGGNGAPDAHGGRGGGWTWPPSYETGPGTTNSMRDWSWWDGWEYGPYSEYWKYSGYGGAVCFEAGSRAKFINCNFNKNSTAGGLTGLGSAVDLDDPLPARRLRINNFGGAVYADEGCQLEFVDCNLAYNDANVALEPGASFAGPNEPHDILVSLGGSIAVEDNCVLKMSNCRLVGSRATMGGAIYARNAQVILDQVHMERNDAYLGGALFTTDCRGSINGSRFVENRAEFVLDLVPSAADPNVLTPVFDPGVLLLQGGGYYSESSPMPIRDSVFTNNFAMSSGGGVYYSANNPVPDGDMSILHNCLLTGNVANRDGGAVSANWYVKLKVSNCTIMENKTTGSFGNGSGLGGGIYAGYASDVEVVDSILWKNIGPDGAQVAVSNGFDFGGRPSRLTMTHSVVGPAYDPNGFDTLGLSMAGSANPARPSGKLVEGQTIYSQFDAGQAMVNVLVSVQDDTGLRAATRWGDPQSEAKLRAEMARRQQQVIARMNPADMQVRYTYQNIPVFSCAVTRSGLARLLEDQMVVSIEPVRVKRVQLRQALSLGNAMEIRNIYNGDGVGIAVVDTGVDYRHPKLGAGSFPNAKVIGGYDTGDNDPDPLPTGNDAHGTCVAGIAAGNPGDFADYVGGVAPGAGIYALKAAADATPGTFLDDAIIAAWDWCITHRNDNPRYPIKVITNSLAGGSYSSRAAADSANPAYAQAAKACAGAGIVVLAAAGNNGTVGGLAAPAAVSNVIAVGAVYDTTDRVPSYSNSAAFLDLLAPADPIYTTDIVGQRGYDRSDYYANFNGTSAACPFVAGAIACLQSAAWQRLHRYLTPAEVLAILRYTGDPVTDIKSNIATPRVNLAAAITGPWGPPIRIEKGCEVNRFVASTSANYDSWDPVWDPASGNIVADPLLVEGYYLSHIAAGQAVDSPCIDAGSLDVNDPNVLLADYTTSTDGRKDTGPVDIGYHYVKGLTAYRLAAAVLPDPIDGLTHGTVKPTSAVVYEGRGSNVVVLHAYPDQGYKVKGWTGTDDDTSTALINRVTITKDTYVTVQFEKAAQYMFKLVVKPSKDGQVHGQVRGEVLDPDGEPNVIDISKPVLVYDGTVLRLTAIPDPKHELTGWTGTDDDTTLALVKTATIKGKDLTVAVQFEAKVVRTLSVPGQYPTIQKAIEAAKDGDTIVVDPGTYYGADSAYSSFVLMIDKSITISSRNPEDPCCVASTIIDGYATMNDWHNLGVIFGPNAGRETVLNGFTIQNCGGVAADGDDGARDANHPDGYDGEPLYGAGILVYTGAKPVIKNCVIRNNTVVGGNGGNGVGATATQNAGRGGWAGYAWGGGVYIMPSDPATGQVTSPLFINCTFEGNWAIGGDGGNGGNGQEDGGLPNYGGNYTPPSRLFIDPNGLSATQASQDLWQVWGYMGDYRWYSGYGGAVFCDKSSQAEFIRCTFRDNHAVGGMSGVGGQQPPDNRNIEPLIAYEIPSYGGAVYCASQAQVRFERCNFQGNTSSQTPEGTDPNHTITPYLGHGGNVAAEQGARVEFVDCNIMDGFAHTGGGIYVGDAYVRIADSNLAGNTALRGGGLFGMGGDLRIEDCNVIFNLAVSDVNDANAASGLGAGGGLMLVQGSPVVRNTLFSGNVASGSGGAIYLRGQGDPTIFNCLFTYNAAGRDGGAISNNWMVNTRIGSSTFVGNSAGGLTNQVTDAGIGGAVFCGNEGVCNILDSILWQNVARRGAQIAVGSGFELDRRCGRVYVAYSDFAVGPNDVYIDKGCTLQQGDGVIHKDPLFVAGPLGPYYLSQASAGQDQTSPCVNAGSDVAGVIGLSSFTTSTNGGPDIRHVDIGYHYRILQPCKFCDAVFDGLIDLHDYAVLAGQWLRTGCNEQNNWCGGADITFDGSVNYVDLSRIAECWLVADTVPPMPDPPVWLSKPRRGGLLVNTITMEARQATDAWGWDVEYLFDCLTGPGHDGDWQRSAVYQDNLPTDAAATYRFKVRDELGNETGWSEVAYVGPVSAVCEPPAGPLSLTVLVVDPCSITVLGGRLNDPDGVEYFFDIDSPDVNDSGWIGIDPNYSNDAPGYRFAGLKPGTTYRIRYKARDLGTLVCPAMETAWSQWLVVTTPAGPERNPPQPNPMQWDTADDPNGPAGWGGRPFEVYVPASFGWAARMTAIQATDDSGYVEYFFDCVSSVSAWDKGYDSGWTTERTYQVLIGTRPSLFDIRFRVKARDAYGNETGWSELVKVVPPTGP